MNGRSKLSYWERRLSRHALLGLASLSVGALIWTVSSHRSRVEGVSFATAYAGLTMLAVALVDTQTRQVRDIAMGRCTDSERALAKE